MRAGSVSPCHFGERANPCLRHTRSKVVPHVPFFSAGIKPPFGLPASVMPGEVPYTSQLPYLVHPAMRTHPSFVPPTDGSMIQGASPLYANFVPPTQVGGYAGTNQGYCGNTYLPDQQAPINNTSGANAGLVQSTMHDGQVDPLGGSRATMGAGSQINEFQKMRLMQASAMSNTNTLSLAPNDQNFVQASGQQNLMFAAGNPFLLRPSAMTLQNTWLHAQTPDRTPHLSAPLGMAPGTISHAQPTTFVSLYQVPSGACSATFFSTHLCVLVSPERYTIS